MTGFLEENTDAARLFPDGETWLAEWLAPRYCRAWTNGRVWCERWREHPEAVSRVDGLWTAWERAVAKNGEEDLAAWWLTYADPMLDVLTSESGPFAKCGNGHTGRLLPLTGP